jgi:hypothetical protein
MTERILGPEGPKRRQRLRLLPFIVLLSVALLVVVSAAVAADPDSPPYTIVTDESGPNDVPGQKDLNLQGVDNSLISSGIIRVLWNWDETSISGSNTLDACTLFDTDAVQNGKADIAVCVSAGGSPAQFLTKTVYTCGDTRVDRCTSPTAPKTVSGDTTCSVANPSNTDPFPGPSAKLKGANYPNDARGKCTIKLSDIDATTAVLINTCSYPSQQPNSDPSDCVLIPRDSFLQIVKDAGGDTATTFNFTVSGGADATPTAKEGSPTTIPIKHGVSTTVTEPTLPSTDWTFKSASCTGGTNQGTPTTNGVTGITAASDATVICTFVNEKKPAPVVTIDKSCPNGAHAATDRFQPKDGTANAGGELTCNTGSTPYSPAPDTDYNITEAGAGTPAADLDNYTTAYSAGCSGNLARGATAVCTITNTLRTFTVVTYVCEGDQLYQSSVTFDGVTKLSLAHSASLPDGVDEQKLCSGITTGARFTDKKSGTKTGSVTITP